MGSLLLLGCGRSSTVLSFLKLQSVSIEPRLLLTAETHPKSVPARLALANFYLQQGRLTEAEQQFRRTIRIDARDPRPYTSLAYLLQIEGKHADAAEVLVDAKKTMPNVPEIYSLLGDFYLLTGDLPRAVEEYASLARQHPEDTRVQKAYIRALLLSNKIEEAAKLNDEFIKVHPNDVDALVVKGQILDAQGRPDQALTSLQAAVEKDSQNPGAHDGLGVTLAGMGNIAQAISELQEAIRLRPQQPRTLRRTRKIGVTEGRRQFTASDC